MVLAMILMSTSARLRALAAVSPPNPDPMMTTLCRSDGVAPGWLMSSCSSNDFTFSTASTVVGPHPVRERRIRVRFAT